MTAETGDLDLDRIEVIGESSDLETTTTAEYLRGPEVPPSRDDISFLALSGPCTGRYYKVPDHGGVLGRDADVEVRIEDPGISREHAELIRTDGCFEIVDLDSRYGVFVEGERVERATLKDGDRVQLSGETVLRVRYQDERETTLLARMQESLTCDALTSVLNRRYFLERLEQEHAFARRHRKPLSVMMVDVDHFKHINDQHGHTVGDQVLAHIGHTLRSTVRTEDLVGRYGGDEFVICVRGLDENGALKFGERLLSSVRSKPATVEGKTFHLTLSIGVGSLDTPKNDGATSLMELVTRADAALYSAKRQGRDRVVAWTP